MNGSGQLGRGIDGAMDPTLFEKVQGAAPALGKKATQIVVGRDHACMRAGGDVSCWGSGSEGELGWGIFRADPSPQVVFGVNDASALASGDRHTCAVVKSGAEVVCWGNNRAGQLGDGTTEKRAMPVVVKGVTGVTALALGLLHSCALKKDGAVVCWGSTGAAGGAPLVVAGLPRVDQITAALNATCARSGKTVRCWGGGHGEKPTVEEYFSGATTIVGDHILGGRELVCAIVDAGEVHCVMPGESYRITNDEDPKTRTRARLVAVGGGNGCYVRDDGVDRIDCDETLKVRPVVEKL